ncbi:hypothetical protein GKZ90_0019420, partial [Flavobacterium sp. MC2016-06]
MQNITSTKINSTKLFLFILVLILNSTEIRAQFPFFESFKNSTAPGVQFGGSPPAFLTSERGIDPINNGYLRLTNQSNYQKGFIWSDQMFSPTYGMSVSFEYYTYGGGGSGGDGIAFILFDATASPVTVGEFGGSLGYAQSTTQSGFSKGYLGIGIDEYGNFSTSEDGRSGGSTTLSPSSVTLRGQGNNRSGYNLLTSAQTTSLSRPFNLKGNNRDATNTSIIGYRKIEINLKPRGAGGFFIDVYLTHDNVRDLVINNYAYITPPPANLKFAVSSSTGYSTNYHEIRNLSVKLDDSVSPSLSNPIANPDELTGCQGETSASINILANDNGSINSGGIINKESVDLDINTPGIQSSIIIPSKGTFNYNSNTEEVTFTPINKSINEVINIRYTFNDSYGKTSNVASINYTPIAKPRDITTDEEINSGETYRWPANGINYTTEQKGTRIEKDGCTADQVLNLTVLPTPTCDGEMQTILKDDFGSGTNDRGEEPSSADFHSDYIFSSSGSVGPNKYSLLKTPNQGNSSWSKGGDHTTGNGYMLVFDANNILGSVFYEKEYSNLCSGSMCKFNIYAANVVSDIYPQYSIKPKVKIDLLNPSTGAVLKTMTSDELPLSHENELLWNELSLSFTIPTGLSSVKVRVSSAQDKIIGAGGNDVAFDDPSVSICVPIVTISASNVKICAGESNILTAVNHNTSTISYSYQWQYNNGTDWVDIEGATSLQYATAALLQTTKYRIRYAQTGVDITNNRNLQCSGSKEFVVEVAPKPLKPVIAETAPTCDQDAISTITNHISGYTY